MVRVLHVHFFVQHPFLQPHRLNSKQTCETSSNVVHNGTQSSPSFFFQPHWEGHGRSGIQVKTLPQIWPPWYAALFACCIKASLVGGIFSIALFFLQYMFLLATFTSSSTLFFSYISMIRRSWVLTILFGNTSGPFCNYWNASVTFSNDSHAVQKDFFPFPWKDGVVSQPEKAWNIGRHLSFSVIKVIMLWWMSLSRLNSVKDMLFRLYKIFSVLCTIGLAFSLGPWRSFPVKLKYQLCRWYSKFTLSSCISRFTRAKLYRPRIETLITFT